MVFSNEPETFNPLLQAPMMTTPDAPPTAGHVPDFSAVRIEGSQEGGFSNRTFRFFGNMPLEIRGRIDAEEFHKVIGHVESEVNNFLRGANRKAKQLLVLCFPLALSLLTFLVGIVSALIMWIDGNATSSLWMPMTVIGTGLIFLVGFTVLVGHLWSSDYPGTGLSDLKERLVSWMHIHNAEGGFESRGLQWDVRFEEAVPFGCARANAVHSGSYRALQVVLEITYKL